MEMFENPFFEAGLCGGKEIILGRRIPLYLLHKYLLVFLAG